MGERGQINMDDDIEKYCVSYMLRNVCLVGLNTMKRGITTKKVYPTRYKQIRMALIQLIQAIYQRHQLRFLNIGNSVAHLLTLPILEMIPLQVCRHSEDLWSGADLA